MRRDVLNEGAARRRRRRASRYLSRTCCESRQGWRGLGLGDRVRAPGKRRYGSTAGAARRTSCAAAGRQIMIRRSVAAIAAMALIALFGCCERPQAITYKQGTYQGKPDTPPYSNAPFNGNRSEWDKAIATRNQNQNEYKRTR